MSTSELPLGIDGIKLFPNPAVDWIQAQVEGQGVNIVKANASSINGQITSLNIEVNANQLKMNVSSLEAGMYVLHIQTNKGMVRTTFVR